MRHFMQTVAHFLDERIAQVLRPGYTCSNS